MMYPDCIMSLRRKRLSKSCMSSEQEPPENCPYCGRPNPEAADYCAGCTTPLSKAAKEYKQPKSKVLAVALAFFLGPLGLFYSSIAGGITMILIGIVVRIGFPKLPWAGLFLCICCSIWAARAVDISNKRAGFEDDAEAMLNKAGDMERKDRAKAVEMYEEVIRLYPGTDACQEAKNNIATLTANRK